MLTNDAGLSVADEKAAVSVSARRQESMGANAHTATAANPFPLASCAPKGPARKTGQTRPIFWILRNTIVNFPTAKVKGAAVFSYINYIWNGRPFASILHKHSYKSRKYAKIILKNRKIGVDLCINNVL